MITTSATTVDKLQQDLSQDILSINQWCANTNMVLNTGKNKTCIITTRQKRARLEQKDLELSLGASPLQTTDCDKLLGVLIDRDLNFKAHVKKYIKKLVNQLHYFFGLKSSYPLQQQ